MYNIPLLSPKVIILNTEFNTNIYNPDLKMSNKNHFIFTTIAITGWFKFVYQKMNRNSDNKRFYLAVFAIKRILVYYKGIVPFSEVWII